MSDQKPQISTAIRIIDNSAIRARHREEVQKTKRLKKKNELRQRAARAREAAKENQQMLVYARQYMAENNVETLGVTVLTEVEQQNLLTKLALDEMAKG